MAPRALLESEGRLTRGGAGVDIADGFISDLSLPWDKGIRQGGARMLLASKPASSIL